MEIDTENEEKAVLEADTVYLLMKKGFPISRSVRAQWILEHLNTTITIQRHVTSDSEETPELEIVSVLPVDQPTSWRNETSYRYQYKITTNTSLIFLAHKYRMVFSLDLSPSLSTVDIQHGEIVIDEIYLATKRCLEGITRPFVIPGSERVMRPEIYVTVIAHTPFFTSPAQQVLVQGWLVNVENVGLLTQFVEQQLSILEERVALVTAIANQQLETLRSESERLVGGLFEEGGTCAGQNNNNSITNISMVSPEASFINMLRYGMLALALLPECSCANLVVVSDGIVGVTDVHVLDSIVQQLRASTVACSFLHVGSTYHPHCSNALVPYQDLLDFLATATLGNYMTFVPQAVSDEESSMNLYHKNYLCWQLYRTVSSDSLKIPGRSNDWHTSNSLFHGNRPPQLLRKKQIDDKVTCTLSSLLCCRLREGYLIKRFGLRDNCLELCFVLPWKTHIFLEYLVSCPWPSKTLPVSNTIHYTITIEAPYEFLHDITCLSKKPLKSQYRQSVVSRFWAALAALTDSDDMLSHFSWFPGTSWTWYNVPDTIRSGMPVFYLPTYQSSSSVLLSDPACSLFGQIWRPVVLLDPSQWARWMHSQRVALILSHDRPLPRHLHLANQSGRFQSVQCRQAAAVLYAMLKDWATFVLVEYHTYVQFIYKEIDKPPVSFSLIRVSCKPPCVVLNIAFAGGTEGIVRQNVVVDLLECLSRLTLPNRPTEQRETPCCIILRKPLERILIRYERVPTDLNTIIFPDGTQPVPARFSPVTGGSLTTTLSRYLYHSRWLWAVKKPLIQTVPNIAWPKLNVTAIARILSTITKMRLTEGFSFAHSSAGIINMVLEVQMQGHANDHITHPCIIQYVLFPPHTIATPYSEKDSGSEEDTDEDFSGTADGEAGTDDGEGCGDFQIVTEVWIEPQCGHAMLPINQTAAYMEALQYRQLPDAIAQVDEECINALLTLEHLSLLSQMVSNPEMIGEIQLGGSLVTNQSNQATLNRSTRRPSPAEFSQGLSNSDDRIRSIPFAFDVLNILPKCQQAELLFSVFTEGRGSGEERDGANRCLMEGLVEHIKRLHNKELIFTPDESQKFSELLISRPRLDASPLNISQNTGREYINGSISDLPKATWRCFVKGISVTHVIITILPASEEDLHSLLCPEESNNQNQSQTDCTDENDPAPVNPLHCDRSLTPSRSVKSMKLSEVSGSSQALDRSSNLSSPTVTMLDIPRPNDRCKSAVDNSKQGLTLPVYVYDCPLATLIDALVNKLDSPRVKDIYQDHTYRPGELVGEDFITLKSGGDTKPSSPEPKSDDSDNITGDQKSMTEHCKLLSLAYIQCYVVAVYKSLALQRPLSYQDMEAAVDQCEEALIEINITNYLSSVCRHLSSTGVNRLESSSIAELSCSDVKPLHNLIREKFERIMNSAFRAVPAHPEFYFCSLHWNSDKMERMDLLRSDSEEELDGLTFHSEIIDCKTEHGNVKVNQLNATWPGASLQDGSKLSSLASTQSLSCDLMEDDSSSQEQPLFLQLNCSVHSRSSLFTAPVKLLPTCFAEILEKLDNNLDEHVPSDLKVTLDIICLNLPREVLEVSLERSPGLRTTSFCSASPAGSTRTNSESSPEYDTQLSGADALQDRIQHLPRRQHNAVSTLVDEIEWLLRDETATALLDETVPTERTLNLVARHVSESNGRPSCSTDKVPLHFVFPAEHCSPKFLEELKNLEIERYRILEEGNLFYFTKRASEINDALENDSETRNPLGNVSLNDVMLEAETEQPQPRDIQPRVSRTDSGDPPGCHSEISSLGEGRAGTDDGYEGDSSDSEDDCHWLTDLDKRRSLMPNFWLILKVENDHVYVYFHCRFLELASPEVERYCQIQKMVVSQIKAICRRVNQYLLLQSLHDTRTCDNLLEPESSEDFVWRSETGSEFGGSHQKQTSGVNMSPGLFRCPVVWEVPFCLHPRLKTGPGKPGLSRGIKALQAVLNRFSVNNRSNMFVYQDNNDNVFYLRLHEQISEVKPLQNKLSESHEKLVVSRSSSITSLSQSKGKEGEILGVDTRPRVRSFGEKESDLLNKPDDLIILMVHGISEAGLEVKCELVEVLQNRLDDAVLEVLSIMLARNPMCKLTPADVHFIQKQYQPPENVVQLLVPVHCLPHIEALGYYLRQNLLQFLHNPKYTDPRTQNHFQDYSKDSTKRVSESDIFLYNQSHSSGSKGIACIALGIVNATGELIKASKTNWLDSDFPNPLKLEHFQEIVASYLYDSNLQPDSVPEALIEFRIWKQGRVNLESLTQKLREAVRHATWDLVTEYKLLPTVLTEELADDDSADCTVAHKETQTPIKSKQYKPPISDALQLTRYEVGEDGTLHQVYRTTLQHWFQFALQINVPAVKKHAVLMQRRHPIPVIAKELQNLIRGHAPDTSSRTFVLSGRQPFIDANYSQEDINAAKSFHMSESMESVNSAAWLTVGKEDNDQTAYVPCDLSKEDQSPIKCLLVARNFYQWKASHSKTIEAEILVPKDQKLLQKFNPLILEDSFVPRQRLLLAKIQSDNIILYMYNWSKERSEKLTKQVTNLGTWLSSRSSLFNNIVMQKLGIFHHQPVQAFPQGDRAAPPYYQITDMETLTKFPNGLHNDGKEWPRSSIRTSQGKATTASWNPRIGQVLRDAKPGGGPNQVNTVDPVVRAAYHLQELRHREKKAKEDFKCLGEMWQSRAATSNIPISLATLNLFKRQSRLIHYCHTPLLFLPKWRLQSAATRDHSLCQPPSTLQSMALQQSPQNAPSHSKITAVSPNATISEWHKELCTAMLMEYKQYLQTLGFNSVRVESQKKVGQTQDPHHICYLQKSMLGGILLFEISLREPYFIAKVRVIECSRLQTKSSSALVNQFMLSFVDACDKVKIDMHLHSFTYDFHLRCIHSYIAGNGLWSLREDYHLTHFLDDFNKYYSKAPNYARNLVYSDTVTVSNLATPARTLYSYLLSNEKACGMQVLGMSREANEEKESDFVLVRLQSTPLVSYCDAQDMKHTDDFDITLIVSRLEQPVHLEKSEITLKYYLMLTSKRELYPKKEVQNNKLGKFRTVYSVARSANNSHAESPSGSSPVSPVPFLQHRVSKIELLTSSIESQNEPQEEEPKTESNDVSNSLAPTPPPVPSSPLTQNPSLPGAPAHTSSHLVQIRQESVNYLGYYSSHEQLMQQMIMSQAHAATARVTTMIKDGAIQCRTHLLWNKLLENRSTMNYSEFTELCTLAQVEPLSKLDPRLSPLLSQPLTWYQTLAKVLINKYQDHHKLFNAPDGNVSHVVVLHPSYLQAFMMLTIDLHTSRGELCAVYRKPAELDSSRFSFSDVYSLIEGFVNACCFHLWMGLYSQ